MFFTNFKKAEVAEVREYAYLSIYYIEKGYFLT